MNHAQLPFALAAVLSLALVTPAWGQSAAELYDYHAEQGNKHQRASRYQEALSHYRTALEHAKKIPGGAKRVDVLYYNLSLALGGTNQTKEELEVLAAVEKYRRKNLGDDHPDTIEVLGRIAITHKTNDQEKANIYVREFLKLSEKRYGSNSLEFAEAQVRGFTILEDDDERQALAQKALAIFESRLGPRAYALRNPMLVLASEATDRGEFQQAEALFKRLEELEGPPNDPIQQRFHRLRDFSHRARYARALGRFLEAVALYQAVLAEHVELARLLPDYNPASLPTERGVLAELYLQMGLPDKSLAEYRQAMTEHERAGTTESAGASFALQGIGKIHHRRGELEEAQRYYTAAKKVGKDRNLALLLADQAALYRDTGDYDQAAPLMEGIAEFIVKQWGKKSPLMSDMNLQRADLAIARGHREAAAKLYQDVINDALASSGNPDVAAARMGQARLALAVDDRSQAIFSADKARRELRLYARRVLPALGEHEQLEFLANREARSLEEALSIALDSGGDRPNVRDVLTLETTAGWILNAKGLAQEAMAQRTLLARETRDPRLSKTLREWLAIRYRLASLSLADPSSAASPQEREREIAALSAREQKLAAQLGRSSARDETREPWVELAAVREKLAQDSVLIEIVRYAPPKPRGPKAAGKQDPKPVVAARYLAWVIPPAGKGAVKLVELGSSDEIDRAVAAARKPLAAARETIAELGEAEAEKALHKELALLSQKLLGPLEPHVKDYRHWVISPDGSLWLVPWSALLLGEGKYLVESHVTRLVVSGRDVVELAGQKASGNPSLVLADPDYDLSGGESPKTESGSHLPADDRRTSAARSAAVRSAVSSAWQRLPGTALEARSLDPKLKEYTGSSVELRLGREAAESVLRDAWRPRVAVLSTHGYFLEPGDEPASGFALKSPLIRCGLVLAGANRRAGGQSPDDGILTGLEIVGADLRGTELVVLSACETGLGEVRAAEGVAGLRQAFQLAGAQSVLATLWRVPDADTAQLMIDFYGRLAVSGDKAGALAEAQRAALARHRQPKGGSGHPYYWGAFTLTGRADRPTVNPPEPRPERPVVRPQVQVVAATAPIMDGAKQLAVARRGDLLETTGEQGEWVLVVVPGRAQPGWIQQRHVQRVDEE